MDDFVLRMTAQTINQPTLQDFANAHPSLMTQLARMSPVQAASAFAGLLTMPELQSNCLRLETLVHLAIAGARGRDKPTDAFIRSAFRTMGEGFCGRMEDPAEDMFVATVRTGQGNSKLLEGMWEGNSFYLQRMINTLDAMPHGTGYDEMRDSVHALLTLSDLVCERSKLGRWQLGSGMPADRLGASTFGSPAAKSRRVRVSIAEIEQAGIDPLSLAPFLFTPQDRASLTSERLGNSSVERRPLIREGDDLLLILPTAVGAAIRMHIVERMEAAGMRRPLTGGLAIEYARHFANVQMLGGQLGTALSFRQTGHGAVAGTTVMIDKGRYLNLVFYTDDLKDFAATGLAGLNPDGDGLGKTISEVIDDAYCQVAIRPDFVDGISLVIGCGIGRGISLDFLRKDYPHWKVEFTSAYDLDTLSWAPRFKPLSLWRLLDSAEKVGALGAGLHNINGLINLVAWARSLDGHLVPHAALPDDFGGNGQADLLMVDQTSLRSLRHEVATYHDARTVQDIDGTWIAVRRDRDSRFDDEATPLYASELTNFEGWLSSVYLAPTRAWWAEASMPQDTSGALAHERWRLVSVWLTRAAPILDGLPGLGVGPVKWRAVFEATTGGLRGQTPERSYEEARAAISVSIDRASRTVVTTATPVFEDAIYHPENIAERALVDAMLEGFLTLAQLSQEDRPALLIRIVQSAQARHAHGFAARNFRDFLHLQLGSGLVMIDTDDDAAVRLGLGWRVRERTLGGHLTGKEETTQYLNALVRAVEEELCNELRAFGRDALIMRLLFNYEIAAFDRDRWQRTASAVLALHADDMSTLKTIADHEMELIAVFQASRILLEMSLCEAAVEGGREPGKLDLSRLMAKAALLFHMGGWSDAIRQDVMEPTIRITPLGDVHARFDFIDEVISPHARETSDVRLRESVETYADNLKQVEGTVSVDDRVDRKFLEAWEDEYGTTFQELRVFVDWLENRGITVNEAVMRMTRADFTDVNAEGQVLSDAVVDRLLERIALFERPEWRVVPEGFDDRDRQPWRFRRRLSVIRRPILRTGAQGDECFYIAPGMVRDAFGYIAGNYLRGDFPPHQLGAGMKAWAARQADTRGAEFTRSVAASLEALGWKTQTEVKITKILGRRLDRDYGDVDVLAWREADDAILIIECKDVQFRKTYGEICEQLADFRGGLRRDGKPDYLKKHLNRMDILDQHADEVAAYLKLSVAHPSLESHLVFKNPVPMKYALAKMSERVQVSLFDEIGGWAARFDIAVS